MDIVSLTTIVGFLVDSIEVMKIFKGFRRYWEERKLGKEAITIPEDQERQLKKVYRGRIGSKIVEALIFYIENGDHRYLNEVLLSIDDVRQVDVVIDTIGRDPEIMYYRQFKKQPEYVYKYQGDGVKIEEFTRVSKSISKYLELIGNLHPSAKKRIILVTPVVMAFQIGQLIGSIVKYYPLHLDRERGYREVEAVIRYG